MAKIPTRPPFGAQKPKPPPKPPKKVPMPDLCPACLYIEDLDEFEEDPDGDYGWPLQSPAYDSGSEWEVEQKKGAGG
jgi:hypothetical protein